MRMSHAMPSGMNRYLSCRLRARLTDPHRSAAKQTQRAIDGQLPSAIRYRESDLADRTVPSTTLNSRLSIRLEQLQNLFLLERLAVKNGVADDLALLGFAREMLGLTLVYWKQLDRSIGNQNDFEWFVSFTLESCTCCGLCSQDCKDY